jgi:hypothetical protein
VSLATGHKILTANHVLSMQHTNPSHHLMGVVHVNPWRLAGSFEGHWLTGCLHFADLRRCLRHRRSCALLRWPACVCVCPCINKSSCIGIYPDVHVAEWAARQLWQRRPAWASKQDDQGIVERARTSAATWLGLVSFTDAACNTSEILTKMSTSNSKFGTRVPVHEDAPAVQAAALSVHAAPSPALPPKNAQWVALGDEVSQFFFNH